MQKNLSMRIAVIVIAVIASLLAIYPPRDWDSSFSNFKEFPKTINLGLDLKGGMHLIIQIDMKYLEDLVKKDPTLNIDQLKGDAIKKTLDIIRNRIDSFGVAEPSIKKLGNDRIEIELPGLRDPNRAKSLVNSQALLEFKMVHYQNDMIIKDIADENGNLLPGKTVPKDYALLYETPRDKEGMAIKLGDGLTIKKTPYLISTNVELSGQDLRAADVNVGQENRPIIAFKLKPNAAEKFEQLTSKHRERNETDNHRLAIVLDNTVIMAPHIKSRIPGGQGIIEGGFTLEEAKDIAIKLRSGSLPVPIKIIEEQVVGPSLGADSISSGLRASFIGSCAVVLFMLVYYLAFGIFADIALFINVILMAGAMALMGATLTLPGIAGLALTIGMGVDANVLIYERIKEELGFGKSLRSAVDVGYGKAFVTIADANITTIIVAVVLYQYGAGPIRGFAVSLTIGIIASMFCAIFVTRTIVMIILQNRNITSIPIFSPIATALFGKGLAK